jgi:predicted outer membrane protein
MIRLYLRNAVLLAAVAAAAYGLAAELGQWPAFLTCIVVSAVACVAGAILLRTSGVGRVTWRNRLAGYLIP